MIKVGILMFQNMRYAPFLKMYENLLMDMNNVQYDVIYYERDKSLNEIKDANHIALPWHGKGTLAAPKYEKFANFLFYANDAKKVLAEKKYDFLIVLTSFPSVLISNYLRKEYSGRFLVDIRDYTQERFKPYFKIEEKVFSKAALCVISSPGFVNFLPNIDYYICHNIDAVAASKKICSFDKAYNRRLVIAYIGSISYETQCKQLIDLVIDDERFEFHFYGNESNGTEISRYINSKNNKRVKMMGEFLPSEKPSIYAASDLVFNCYGNDRILVKYAISNKYYDGAIYKRPLLVSPNTSMAEFSQGFAYALDLGNIDGLDDLYSWYYGIDEEEFISYSDSVINKSLSENTKFLEKVRDCILKSEVKK